MANFTFFRAIVTSLRHPHSTSSRSSRRIPVTSLWVELPNYIDVAFRPSAPPGTKLVEDHTAMPLCVWVIPSKRFHPKEWNVIYVNYFSSGRRAPTVLRGGPTIPHDEQLVSEQCVGQPAAKCVLNRANPYHTRKIRECSATIRRRLQTEMDSPHLPQTVNPPSSINVKPHTQDKSITTQILCCHLKTGLSY